MTQLIEQLQAMSCDDVTCCHLANDIEVITELVASGKTDTQ